MDMAIQDHVFDADWSIQGNPIPVIPDKHALCHTTYQPISEQ